MSHKRLLPGQYLAVPDLLLICHLAFLLRSVHTQGLETAGAPVRLPDWSAALCSSRLDRSWLPAAGSTSRW